MSKKLSLVTQLTNPALLPTVSPVFSLSSSFNSPATVVRYLDNCSYQLNVLTTDSMGVFQVEVSNDYYVDEINGNKVQNIGNWVPLTLAGGTPTVSATDTNISIALEGLPFYACRLAYTSSTAGTGTVQIYVTNKSLGG